MSFDPAPAKLTITSSDIPSIKVKAQYNPKEVQIDKTIAWSKVNQANQSNDKGIHLEFTGAEGRGMSVDMLFDGYENNGTTSDGLTVLSCIQSLETLASVIDPSSTLEDKRRPHLCVVTWGAGGMPSFRCVIESLSTKYTMFSGDGAVLRATCTVKLKEADIVTLAAAAGGAKK